VIFFERTSRIGSDDVEDGDGYNHEWGSGVKKITFTKTNPPSASSIGSAALMVVPAVKLHRQMTTASDSQVVTIVMTIVVPAVM
jgi:hypothetical protein